MRANSLFGLGLALAASLLMIPTARAEIGDCPDNNCIESTTTLVYDPPTNTMFAFTSVTTDYETSVLYYLCVDLEVSRLNGPSHINATPLITLTNPMYCNSLPTSHLETWGNVPAIPGRQYIAAGHAKLLIINSYSDWFPECGPYCTGYWYDAFDYSHAFTTQPSDPHGPSIGWTYNPLYTPFVDPPVAVYTQQLAMTGSMATAWSPPRIDSITPGQWPAGGTTTFTITGAGFGYSPNLAISGSGVMGYANSCAAPNSSSSCDTQIVATVTIDASTPGGMVETITVTANGLNPSGYLPVAIDGQSGQATGTATTLAFVAPVPQIWFNGQNIAGQTTQVYVGQRVPLSAVVNLPEGAVPPSQAWNKIVPPSGPSGGAVGGYNVTQTSASVVTLPGSATCQTLSDSCLTFYWVDPGIWQWQYTYTYANQSRSAIATFNVIGPSTLAQEIVTQIGGAQTIVPTGTAVPYLYLLGLPFQGAQTGIVLQAAALGAMGNSGTYQWVQILNTDQIKLRTQNGEQSCLMPSYPALDNSYPYGIAGGNLFSVNRPNDTVTDNPGISLSSSWGEARRLFSATMYLMWDPALPAGCIAARRTTAGPIASNCDSIPVPVASVAWQFGANGINTLQVQAAPNGSTWVAPCGPGQAGQCATVAPGTDPSQSFPQWSRVFVNGQITCP